MTVTIPEGKYPYGWRFQEGRPTRITTMSNTSKRGYIAAS